MSSTTTTTTTAAGEKTVGQWVVERPSRARVFERLGIDYCCGGKHPLQVACAAKHLPYDAVLAELQRDADTGSKQTNSTSDVGRNWASASLTDLCDHIEHTHHAWLKQELPRLDALTAKVATRHGDRVPAYREIYAVFRGLRAEMESHMAKEERVLFPLCRELDTAERLPVMPCGSVNRPIEVMIREHEDAGDALARLRALTNCYTPSPDACNTVRAMIAGLQELEQDMHLHVHKENNILFPKAARIERLLLRGSASV